MWKKWAVASFIVMLFLGIWVSPQIQGGLYEAWGEQWAQTSNRLWFLATVSVMAITVFFYRNPSWSLSTEVRQTFQPVRKDSREIGYY